MKIALLHYSSPPVVGGVEGVLAQHARLMANAGHQVTVLTGRGEVFDERVPVRVLPSLDSRHPEVMQVKNFLDKGEHTPAFEMLREHIRKELLRELTNYDVLIAHNVASLHKNLALTAVLHEEYDKPGFPHLILWHHDLAWSTPRYRAELHDGYPWNILRTNWEGVTQVVVSELRRSELSELYGISEQKIKVIPNGVDIAAFFKFESQTVELIDQLNLLEADPLFLLPVRLTPRKNIELALNVMAHLRDHFPRAMLLVTGPEGPHNPNNRSYRHALMTLRDRLGLQKAAHFLAELSDEFLSDDVIADFYRLADALLLPSREEGFGIPIIEAAFSKLPVFCADIPVLRELADGHVTYFDPDAQPEDVARLIKLRLEAETTSRWGRRAKRGFTWDQIYSVHIAALLKEVM